MYTLKMSICDNTSTIPIFRKLKKGDYESKASLGYVVRSQLKTEAEMGGYRAREMKGGKMERRGEHERGAGVLSARTGK